MMAFPLRNAVNLIFLLLISWLGNSSAEDHINHNEHFDLRLIRQEIGFLREENRKQSTEIMVLKETVQLQNKSITKHEITMKELDHEMKKTANCCKSSTDSREEQKRIKRPARLLPLQLLFDRDDDDEDRTTKKLPLPKFYGPPTNCSDLSRLGYTLNGYYLVKHNYTATMTENSYYSSNSAVTDTVYCSFKQDGTFNPSRVEQRLELSHPLDKLVIEELDKVLANKSHSGKWNLANATETRMRDEDVPELKKEMFQLQQMFEDFRLSVIDELNQVFATNGNSGKWNLTFFTEKRKDEDTLELTQVKPQYVVKDLNRPSTLYMGTPYTSTIVCFAVHRHQVLLKSNQPTGSSVVKFQNVVLNLGESFNKKENVFIAPNEGIYEFIFNGYKRGYNKEPVLKVSLRLNGKKVVNSLAEELMGDHPKGLNPVHNYRCPISMHSLLKLKKGDRIDVISSQGTLHDHDSHYPIHFSGKLLFDEDAKSSQHLNSPVAVYFFLQKRTGFNTSNSVIPFEVESLNVGGAFDKKKNAFIAPVSGIYEFTLRGHKTAKREENIVFLRLNGNFMGASLASKIISHDHHTQFSINSLIKVEKGGIVDLYLQKGQIYDDENQYTTFTGKLLLMKPSENSLDNTISKFHSLAVFFNVQKKYGFRKQYQVVPFEIEVLNVGEAFNMSENAFKAPRGGIYEFFFLAYHTGNYMDSLHIALRLNGIPVTYASADVPEGDFNNRISLQSILKLKKGDRIDTFMESGELFDNIQKHTHFTGKLLFAVANEEK